MGCGLLTADTRKALRKDLKDVRDQEDLLAGRERLVRLDPVRSGFYDTDEAFSHAAEAPAERQTRP